LVLQHIFVKANKIGLEKTKDGSKFELETIPKYIYLQLKPVTIFQN